MSNLRQRHSLVILSAVFVRVISQIDLHQSSHHRRSRRHKSSQISLSAILTACKEDQFECAPGYCVPLSRRCDGYTDCVGGRDEQNCYNMSTNYHYLLQSAAKRHTRAKHVNQLLALESRGRTSARAKLPLRLPRNSFDSLNYFARNVAANICFFFSIVDIKLRILRKHDIPGPRYEDTRSPWDSNAGNYTEHEATEKFIRVFLFRKIFVIKTNCIRSSFEGHQCLVFPCRMIRNIHETTKRFATRTSAARGRYEFYCIFWVQGWKGYGTREFSWAWMVPAQHEIWAPAFLTH